MYWILPLLNFFLAVGGLVLLAITAFLFVDYFFLKSKYAGGPLKIFLWPVTILVTIGTVSLSLVYSEYFGFIPCSLCWLQRIAVYSQALMALVARKMEDQRFFPVYGICLSIFGFIVAVYQYIYQMVPKDALADGLMPCLADGTNADCALKVIDEFGFVTFPFISAVSFAFLIVVYLNMRRS